MSSVSHDLVSMVTRPLPSTSSSTSLEVDDSGIVSSLRQGEPPSSILSSPAHSTVTPPTLPAGSEVSTMSSSLVFQGFSSLWVQLLVSKLVINMYNQQLASSTVPLSKSSKYSTPYTSPSVAAKDISSSVKPGDGLSSSRAAGEGSDTIKVSLEVDGISLQVDIQERCTDMIFKMASMECSYLKKCCKELSTASWLPYLSNSNGKLFSTSSSSLPEELSRMTDPLSHPPLVPFEQAAVISSSSPQHHHHPFSPKLQPNFVQLKVKLPSSQLLRTKKLSFSVKPFEVVAWLPVLDTVMEIVSAAVSVGGDGRRTEHKDARVHVSVSLCVCESCTMNASTCIN